MGKFYLFRQNNSGGVFVGPVYVVVEAESADEAWTIAIRDTEVYMDDGTDCECCGPRWLWFDDQWYLQRAPVGVIANELKKRGRSFAIYPLDGPVCRID